MRVLWRPISAFELVSGLYERSCKITAKQFRSQARLLGVVITALKFCRCRLSLVTFTQMLLTELLCSFREVADACLTWSCTCNLVKLSSVVYILLLCYE